VQERVDRREERLSHFVHLGSDLRDSALLCFRFVLAVVVVGICLLGVGRGCGAKGAGAAVPTMARVEFSRIEYADTAWTDGGCMG